MNYFPIFIDIARKPCLVVGGGDIAFRKIKLLLKANAQIICVAPKFSIVKRAKLVMAEFQRARWLFLEICPLKTAAIRFIAQ